VLAGEHADNIRAELSPKMVLDISFKKAARGVFDI